MQQFSGYFCKQLTSAVTCVFHFKTMEKTGGVFKMLVIIFYIILYFQCWALQCKTSFEVTDFFPEKTV